MKLCTFTRPDDTMAHGRLTEDGLSVIDLGDGDLLEALRRGDDLAADGPHVAGDSVTVLSPFPRPGKLLACATNYQEHIVEGGGTPVDKSRTAPKLFLKPDTAIAGPGEAFTVPPISHEADWEVELAVFIRDEVRDVSVEDAMGHVLGYATSNDLSLRSLDVGYERDMGGNVGFFDWLEGKWADRSAPVGPWLVTADEVADPQRMPLRLTVNGETKQESSTSEMIFSVAELVSFASRLCTLRLGDVILTGTPSGVGATTSTFLKDGDVMVAEVEGLGRLETPILAL
jgi:2-keto-4-pentenoate hydratase/2-oxohepta-3-ene-1,7-dioic acid hydratase in catechol pathway